MSRRVETGIEAEALFRYELISAVMFLERLGTSRSAAVREVAATAHPYRGSPRRVSERTLWRWLRNYRDEGVEGLNPHVPENRGGDAISDRLLTFVRAERAADPAASIPELIRRARLSNVLGEDEKVSRISLWRAMKRKKIETRRRKRQAACETKRRFAFAERMQLVMADFKHFRVGPTRRKRVALYLLDDATRFGLGVWIATSEQAIVMLEALHEVVVQHGLMDVLYFDRGSAFRAEDVLRICARVGIHAVLGTAGYPEARGKIERFNRSVDERLLAGLDGAEHAPDCDEALRLLLRHDLHKIYNHLPHSGLGQRSPHDRWSKSTRALKPAPEGDALREAFAVPLQRTVSGDNVISVDGVAYEMPRGHARERIELWRRPLEDALFFQHEGAWMRLREVDAAANAIRPPKRATETEEKPQASRPASSQRSLNQALSPMVDSYGNFKE